MSAADLAGLEPPTASFASDNFAGVMPAVMDAVVAANSGPAPAYGDDRWTAEAIEDIRGVFGAEVEVSFCWGGTGANVVALGTLCRSWEGVVCPATAHINVDECGAPERVAGVKLLPVATPHGRLTPNDVEHAVAALGNPHHTQPRVVSISQSTEYGTLYAVDEIAALCETAHRHELLVHLDGARLANAVAALGVTPAETTVAAGVDVVSFGGTKAGMMYGEAVVFARPELAAHAEFVRKQSGQLPSKMRYVGAQFSALLRDDRWLTGAAHANAMAARLAERAGGIPGITITQEPQVNAVFATLPAELIEPLQAWSFFWDWDQATSEVRWMTSFATTPADVDTFVVGLAAALSGI